MLRKPIEFHKMYDFVVVAVVVSDCFSNSFVVGEANDISGVAIVVAQCVFY